MSAVSLPGRLGLEEDEVGLLVDLKLGQLKAPGGLTRPHGVGVRVLQVVIVCDHLGGVSRDSWMQGRDHHFAERRRRLLRIATG